jgi:prepilin-type N-terminal cleavage/methylation domain-containing protein
MPPASKMLKIWFGCGCNRQSVNEDCNIYRNPLVASFTPQNKTEKQNMKTTKTSRKAGFTLVEIMIVVAIIGLLAAIAIPNFIKARATSQQNACINNLRQIDGAINEWAMETGQSNGASVPSAQTVSAYIKLNAGNSVPTCPAGGSYSTTTVGDNPQVSCSLSTLNTPHKLP